MVAEKSLRGLVGKLLGTQSGQSIRVLSKHRSRSGRTRRVCLEVQRPGGSLALFLFRHGDGVWHVFPPGDARPSMSSAVLPQTGQKMAKETAHG
ncbi:hypothetical protein KNO81_01440 [Paraburkholderia sediminicola]|nr:hypothetical protein [Paraburkholderia sediminicola]